MSRGRLALVLPLAATYSLCYSAIKAGLAMAPPFRFAGLRAGIAAATLFAFLAVRGQRGLPPAGSWPWIFALAFAGGVVEYSAMFHSPGHTGAGISSVLGNTGPLMVIVLAASLLSEPVTPGKLVSLAMGLLGVSLIAYPAITDPSRSGVSGALLPLAAAAGSASASVLFKRMRAGEALLTVAAWQLLLAAGPLLAGSIWFERSEAITWSPRFLLLLGLLGMGTALALALWYWLVQREEVSRLSLFLFLTPLFGLMWARVFFGERVGALEGTGIALTLAGVLLALRVAPRESGIRWMDGVDLPSSRPGDRA